MSAPSRGGSNEDSTVGVAVCGSKGERGDPLGARLQADLRARLVSEEFVDDQPAHDRRRRGRCQAPLEV